MEACCVVTEIVYMIRVDRADGVFHHDKNLGAFHWGVVSWCACLEQAQGKVVPIIGKKSWSKSTPRSLKEQE
jgi:hypothetical protein